MRRGRWGGTALLSLSSPVSSSMRTTCGWTTSSCCLTPTFDWIASGPMRTNGHSPPPTPFSRPNLQHLTNDVMADAVMNSRGHSGTFASNPWLVKDAQLILQQHPTFHESWMNLYGAEDIWGLFGLADFWYLPNRQLRPFTQLVDWVTSSQSERDAALQSLNLPLPPPAVHQVSTMEGEDEVPPDYIRLVDTWLPGSLATMANLSSATSTELWPYTRVVRRGMVFCEAFTNSLIELTLDLVAAEDERSLGREATPESGNVTAVPLLPSSPPCSSRCPRHLPVQALGFTSTFLWYPERDNHTFIASLITPSIFHVFVHPIKISQPTAWQLYRNRYHLAITAAVNAWED